jgi:hypothetical protein
MSELLALKWRDVNFRAREISFTRSIVFQVVGPCKTEASQMPIPLDSYLAKALRAWRKHTKYRRPDDWILASPASCGRRPYWASPASTEENLSTSRKKARSASGFLGRIDISLHFSTSTRSHNPAIPGDTPGPSDLNSNRICRTGANVGTNESECLPFCESERESAHNPTFAPHKLRRSK